jgi:hypothetical protein
VRTSSVLVAKAKRSVLLVLHVPSVSVALAPRSPVALTVPAEKTAAKETAAKETVVMAIVRASQTVHVVKIAVKEAVVMVIAPASQTVPVAKIAAKEAVVRVVVPASQTAPVVKIAAKEAVPRKKMKGDCGLMIASATAMKRDVNVLGISALSISRPSLEVAMSSH